MGGVGEEFDNEYSSYHVLLDQFPSPLSCKFFPVLYKFTVQEMAKGLTI